ncbi:fructosamine kinase family protein [Aliagarivorans marinus]|uniref:fructosamine kinase family protein n=1 Tax=Aliagarivorans marinus TaxID=561965 RepID=UPI0003FE0691|nr:fructosamine kinase family protein [Aliagarivorans marinus]
MQLSPAYWDKLQQTLQSELDLDIPKLSAQPIAGGDIHTAFRIFGADERSWFIKLNQDDHLAMLQAEVAGLQALDAVAAIRVPKVVGCGRCERLAYLVMEYLSLSHAGDEQRLGEALANLHKASLKHSELRRSLELGRGVELRYGFAQDNFIGLTAQANQPSNNWQQFWLQQRLLPQLELAYRNGFADPLREHAKPLIPAVEQLLAEHRPAGVLLHGDLWSGNKGFVAVDGDKVPVLFDPACYYGDRETDLAMTELFGGFSPAFYQGYQTVWPLEPDYPLRKPIYQLYHLLNHLNLFGGGYLNQVVSCMAQIKAQSPSR